MDVLAYLAAHPDFLKKHPELLSVLVPPARELGDGVVDFQQFQLSSMQKNTAALKHRYEGLVDFCRDNLSVQSQVHDAVLQLVRARSLEQLLEVLVLDLVALFDVDVVRLAVESPTPMPHESLYSDQHFSGIVFVEMGMVDMALHKGRKAVLVPDGAQEHNPAFESIFADSVDLIRSYALLRLTLEQAQRPALLAFGVRHAGRFQASQGIELLSFLAQIVAHQLDRYIPDF